MLITEQMRRDMQKIKDGKENRKIWEDMLCCSDCGSINITEKCWIFINDVAVLDGECYQRVDDCDSDMIWCKDCNDVCHTVNLQEWKENNPKR